MTDQEIEARIQELRLNAPRVTNDHIDSLIHSVSYTVLPSGKVTVCEIILKNGFSVRGESAVVSKENFNEEIGNKIAYQNARNEIWQLEGYLLQQRLYDRAMDHQNQSIINVTTDDMERLQLLLEEPPKPNAALEKAMARFKSGQDSN